jgi:hypothetical protein
MNDSLLVGRTPTKLSAQRAPVVADALFQADRVDSQSFEGVKFEHCTFANVSFKDAELTSCAFENCVFMDCYFRMTVVNSSRFLGCKFISCDFPKTSFRQCSFVYAQFRSCYVPYDEFESSLPTEPNLRRLLAENLAREAEAAGATSDGRSYRLQAYRAYEQYLWHGFLASDEWSRQHFPSVAERVLAGIRLIGRWANRLLWGYGERGWVLVRNAAILTFGLFPLVFYLARDGLTQSSGRLGAGSYFFLSADNLLNRTGFSGVDPTTSGARLLVGLEVLLGLVFIGLAITLLFRWITRR